MDFRWRTSIAILLWLLKDIGAPAFYVFPIAVIVGLPRTQTWNKVYLRNIKKAEFYRENWLLISEFLGGTPSGG